MDNRQIKHRILLDFCEKKYFLKSCLRMSKFKQTLSPVQGLEALSLNPVKKA